MRNKLKLISLFSNSYGKINNNIINTDSLKIVSLRTSLSKYDTNIYKISKLVEIDPVLFKSICMKESTLQSGVNRAEHGYIKGKYAKQVKRSAIALKDYALEYYGFAQSVETYVWQLSLSWDICQIMGEKAYELGWRGLSFANTEYGLSNTDTALYYGAKLIKKNVKRYGNDTSKIISAYNAGTATKKNYKKYVLPVLEYMKLFKNDFDKYDSLNVSVIKKDSIK
jgi:hypothetical protein